MAELATGEGGGACPMGAGANANELGPMNPPHLWKADELFEGKGDSGAQVILGGHTQPGSGLTRGFVFKDTKGC